MARELVPANARVLELATPVITPPEHCVVRSSRI
jgi:hypothetical protein